jgi:hypothetical protein
VEIGLARPGEDLERRFNRSVGGLLLMIAADIAGFTYWSVRNHAGFHTGAFDIGIFDQGVWLLSRFHEPFVTARGLLIRLSQVRVLPGAPLELRSQQAWRCAQIVQGERSAAQRQACPGASSRSSAAQTPTRMAAGC